MSWQRSVMCPARRRGWMRQRVARPEAGPPGPPLPPPPPPHTSTLPGLAAGATRPEGHPESGDTSRPDLLPTSSLPQKTWAVPGELAAAGTARPGTAPRESPRLRLPVTRTGRRAPSASWERQHKVTAARRPGGRSCFAETSNSTNASPMARAAPQGQQSGGRGPCAAPSAWDNSLTAPKAGLWHREHIIQTHTLHPSASFQPWLEVHVGQRGAWGRAVVTLLIQESGLWLFLTPL